MNQSRIVNQKMNHTLTRVMGLAAVCSLMSWGSLMSASAQPRPVTLESGSVLPVKLDDALSSKDSRKGDTFTATIRNDADSQYYHLPTGTRIEGVVRDVRPKRDKDPGVIDLDFRRLRFPDGKSYAIEGSLIGLDNKSVDKSPDGRIIAKPGHKTDRLTYVGYGAGAGLIVGLLTKHGLEDTVLGGGLGYLFGALQKGGNNDPRDVSLKQGTEIGVRLDRTVTLANYGSADDYNNYRNRNQPEDGRYHRTNDRDDNGKGYRQDDRPNRPGLDGRDSNQDRGNAADIGMLIGRRDVKFPDSSRPFMSKGVVMLPLRPVLDATHIPFGYDAANQQVKVTGDGGTVRLAQDSSIAIVENGRRVPLGAPAQKINGVLYVPMRFFSLVTGNDVSYDAGSRTVVMQPRERRDSDRPRDVDKR